MPSCTRLAGVTLAACLGLSACTGRDILAMRKHPEQPEAAAVTAPAAPFKGPALAAATDYPKNPDSPRPQPPAAFASAKDPLQPTPENLVFPPNIFSELARITLTRRLDSLNRHPGFPTGRCTVISSGLVAMRLASTVPTAHRCSARSRSTRAATPYTHR